MRRVTITTGARLHFGLLCPPPSVERVFGGIGLMIDQPGFQVVLQTAETTRITAPPEVKERIRVFVRQSASQPTDSQSAVHIEVRQHIPSHSGLGSGTQLGMAIGRGLAELHGVEYSAVELAGRMGRGHRSAIGIHGFQRGGFIVDAGKTSDRRIGELASRLEWPDDWPIVLITLDQSAGLSGDAENAAFKTLAPMTEELIGQLGSIIENQIVPSLTHRRQSDFCTALDQYGDLVGDYFGPAQGGRYADLRMRRLVAELRRQKGAGIAQSSWGPTVCVVCQNQQHANEIIEHIQSTSFEGHARIVSGLNHGATCEHSESLATQR